MLCLESSKSEDSFVWLSSKRSNDITIKKVPAWIETDYDSKYGKGSGLVVCALISSQCTMLCFWAWRSALTVPLSTQVYKWVPANLKLGFTLQWIGILVASCFWWATSYADYRYIYLQQQVQPKIKLRTYLFWCLQFFPFYQFALSTSESWLWERQFPENNFTK